MRNSRRHYDEWADRLAAGELEACDEAPVTALVRSLRSAAADESTAGTSAALVASEARRTAAGATAHRKLVQDVTPLTVKWRRRAMVSTFLSTLFGKLAAAGLAVAIVATGAAATGNLPAPAQEKVAAALAKAGVHIPGADESEDDVKPQDASFARHEPTAPVLPDAASDTAKAVTSVVFENDPHTGMEFGKAVSGAAVEAADGGNPHVLPELPKPLQVYKPYTLPDVPEPDAPSTNR